MSAAESAQVSSLDTSMITPDRAAFAHAVLHIARKYLEDEVNEDESILVLRERIEWLEPGEGPKWERERFRYVDPAAMMLEELRREGFVVSKERP